MNDKSADLSNFPWAFDLIKALWGVYFRIIGVEYQNPENIPRYGGAILAANHITAIDPFGAAQPMRRRVHFMAKQESFLHAPLSWYMVAGNAFPVERGKLDLSAIKTALRLLQNNQLLVIFPQGTRGGRDLKGGTSFLALKAKVPVVPVGIRLENNWFGGKRYVFRYGQPILPEGSNEQHTKKLEAAILALEQPINNP
ncbi:MAG: lysophospholipid acyltransferase family protein [Deinococcales bacterium]